MTESFRTPRFVLIGMSGLSPEAVTPDRMPALSRFLAQAHVWTKFLAQGSNHWHIPARATAGGVHHTLEMRERLALCAMQLDELSARVKTQPTDRALVDQLLEKAHTGHLAEVTVLRLEGARQQESAHALWQLDRQFDRIYSWWKCTARAQGVQLVTLSDCGPARVVRRFDPAGHLRTRGFRVITTHEADIGAALAQADIVLNAAEPGSLWLKEPTEANLERVRDALMAHPDIGMVFSAPDPLRPTGVVGRVAGTFSEALICPSHAHTPDLRFFTRGEADVGEVVGLTSPPDGALHPGGLLPQDQHCLLGLAGNRFARARVHDTPACQDDLAVTILETLGLQKSYEVVNSVPQGRFLSEALECEALPEPIIETLSLRCGAFTQCLVREHVAQHIYVTGGLRTNSDGWRALTGLPLTALSDERTPVRSLH